MIRYVGLDHPIIALAYGLGPLCGFYLQRIGGGNGIVGGTAGGFIVALIMSLIIYSQSIFLVIPNIGILHQLSRENLTLGVAGGLLLGVAGWATDRTCVMIGARKRA